MPLSLCCNLRGSRGRLDSCLRLWWLVIGRCGQLGGWRLLYGDGRLLLGGNPLLDGGLLRCWRAQDREQGAAGFRRPLDCAANRFDHDLHVVAARMHHPIRGLSDGDVTLPKQKIAPLYGLKIAGVHRLPGAVHLHIGVAHTRNARQP